MTKTVIKKHKWGIFCEAALKYDRNAPPRYKAYTKKEAVSISKLADKECESGCKHPIKEIK